MSFSNFCDAFDEFESNRKLSKDTRAKRAATKFDPFPRGPVGRTDVLADPPPREARREHVIEVDNSQRCRRRPRRHPVEFRTNPTPATVPPSQSIPARRDAVKRAAVPFAPCPLGSRRARSRPSWGDSPGARGVNPRRTKSSWSAAPQQTGQLKAPTPSDNRRGASTATAHGRRARARVAQRGSSGARVRSIGWMGGSSSSSSTSKSLGRSLHQRARATDGGASATRRSSVSGGRRRGRRG